MRFDPTEMNTREYVSQIEAAFKKENYALVEVLLEEYGAKAYRQAREDAAAAIAQMLRS